ncbi:hypothetical protein GCM10011584_35410 [Nocardioides phosphati]|uniref:Uncharacterized protein n=1 Tax=Nocardioides phosphati TaxID=1867775 RepID=A0ABQ2NFY9_9ACTN|nr:hypothetical protein GCM10011584_35410 [Nocardioides phosphati]
MTEILTRAELPVVSATFNGRAQTLPDIVATLSAVNGLWVHCADLSYGIAVSEGQRIDLSSRELFSLPQVESSRVVYDVLSERVPPT